MIDCPMCGSDEIIYEDGFGKCTVCDYSELDDRDESDDERDYDVAIMLDPYEDAEGPEAAFDVLAVN